MVVGVVGISVFVATLSYLIYKRPQESWSFLVSYLRPLKRRRLEDAEPQEPRLFGTAKKNDAISPKGNAIKSSTGALSASSSLKADSVSPKATPKAHRRDSLNATSVPTISLDSSAASQDGHDSRYPASSPEQHSLEFNIAPKPPPLKPLPCRPQESSLKMMLPPPRPSTTASLRPRPNATNSLRVPSSGPLPNRGPPSTSSLAPSRSSVVRTPNGRQKIQLKPGYSPLDWAILLKSGANLSGVSTFQRVTPSQLKYNNGRKGRPAWSMWRGKIYNITPYLPYHPGGEGELMRAAGKDGEKLFMEAHPWVNWENMLGDCLVGILVGEHEGTGEGLDAMD